MAILIMATYNLMCNLWVFSVLLLLLVIVVTTAT